VASVFLYEMDSVLGIAILPPHGQIKRV